MKITLQVNTQVIERAVSKALHETAVDVIDPALKSAITDRVWSWPNVTLRRNGQRVSSPRNIVDLGELRDSQQMSLRGNGAYWEWDAPHAIYVQNGYTTRSGTTVPGRDWVAYGLAQVDIPFEVKRRVVF